MMRGGTEGVWDGGDKGSRKKGGRQVGEGDKSSRGVWQEKTLLGAAKPDGWQLERMDRKQYRHATTVDNRFGKFQDDVNVGVLHRTDARMGLSARERERVVMTERERKKKKKKRVKELTDGSALQQLTTHPSSCLCRTNWR